MLAAENAAIRLLLDLGKLKHITLVLSFIVSGLRLKTCFLPSKSKISWIIP